MRETIYGAYLGLLGIASFLAGLWLFSELLGFDIVIVLR